MLAALAVRILAAVGAALGSTQVHVRVSRATYSDQTTYAHYFTTCTF